MEGVTGGGRHRRDAGGRVADSLRRRLPAAEADGPVHAGASELPLHRELRRNVQGWLPHDLREVREQVETSLSRSEVGREVVVQILPNDVGSKKGRSLMPKEAKLGECRSCGDSICWMGTASGSWISVNSADDWRKKK
jgi:hypothetical protein